MSKVYRLNSASNSSTGEKILLLIARSITSYAYKTTRLLDGQGDDIPHYGKQIYYGFKFPYCWLITSAGLELAKLADLPDDIMFEARRVANNLARIEAEKQASSKTSQVVARRKALLTVHPSISSIVVA